MHTGPPTISTIQQRLTTADVTSPARFAATVAAMTEQLLGTLDTPNVRTFRVEVITPPTGVHLVATIEATPGGRAPKQEPTHRKAAAITANRALYPRTGTRWEPYEDALLADWVSEGCDEAGLVYLAAELQRTPNGIGQHAVALGLTRTEVTAPIVRRLQAADEGAMAR